MDQIGIDYNLSLKIPRENVRTWDPRTQTDRPRKISDRTEPGSPN